MKKVVCLSLILALALTAAFAGGSKDKQAAPAAAATKSNKIVIYTSMFEDVIKAVEGVLSKKFPNYDIVFTYGGTGQIQARVDAEQAANKLGCDILMVAEPAYSLELAEFGMLHPFKSKEAENLVFDYDPDGLWYPVRVSNMVLAYNPARNAKNAIPNSFYDFAHDQRVKGAISMSNPLTSGTAMATVTALRDKYGYAYFDALGSQGVAIDSGSVALAKLETGEYKVIMVLEESVLKKRQEEKSRLEVIYPTDGVIMIPSTIMIVNDQWNANKNTPAAEAIADWFLSEEGQAAIVNAWMHSVRANYPKLPYDAAPTDQIRSNSIPVNWDNYFRQRDEIRHRFEDYIINRK